MKTMNSVVRKVEAKKWIIIIVIDIVAIYFNFTRGSVSNSYC
jgi:hypothetical protein